MKWEAGQKAVINRRQVVTIERVSPTGRVSAGGIVFDCNGYGRTPSRRRPKLEPLTPEIQAEMELTERALRVADRSLKAVLRAERWLREMNSVFRPHAVSRQDVEKAERLMSAITDILGEP